MEINPQNIIEKPEGSDVFDGEWETAKNSQFRCGSGKLLRVNTNGNNGYNFLRTTSPKNLFVTEESKGNIFSENELSSVSDNQIVLVSEKVTDFLFIRLSKTPPYLEYGEDLNHKAAVRSGWRSLAELFRKGISLLEDIEPVELHGGFQWIVCR